MRRKLVSLQDMKRVLLILFCTMVAVAAAAQSNPYEIDDECYTLFSNGELTLGSPEFRAYNDSLLSRAQLIGDKKAEVLYYVNELKNITKELSRVKVVDKEDDMLVEESKEALLKISEKYGYMQYYYYGIEVTQNYYFNHGQKALAMRIAEETHEEATRRKDEYGIWYTAKYLISLYREREDYITSREYILRSLKTFETTTNKTIKRQSPSRLYCDLSDTYPVGSDSMYYYIDKAAATAITHMDSARVWFYQAVIHALRNEPWEYAKYAEKCRKDKLFSRMNVASQVFFEDVDNIIEGKKCDPEKAIKGIISSRNVKFLANIAEIYGDGDFAFELEKLLVVRLERNLSKVGMANLAEMNAHIGNISLSADLLEKEKLLAKTTVFIFVLIALFLLSALIFTMTRMATLRRNNKKDEEMIAKLTQANETARLANEAKTRFIQNMSHEVRTPLNAIVGFSQLLSLPDGSFSPEEKDEFSNHIINNSKMLNMLLDDILNASAMDSGNYKISLEEGESHFMCKSAISSSEHRLQPGVTMEFRPENEEPFVFRTDPRRVQQILINLLTNACKHTTKGSIVLSDSLTANPGFVTFTVEDTGTGVPPEQAEAIFNRFTKLNEFVQGTGLGLSICRDISERMGGHVWLDTSYTGGARFVLTIPVEPPQNLTQ